MKKNILFMFAFIYLAIPFSALSDTTPELKKAQIWLDNFLGNGKTMIVADVISINRDALKFKMGETEYNYSGHYSIYLIKARQHTNPLFGLGSPEKAKLIIFEDFFKNDQKSDATMMLSNATVWEKSGGFIDAEASGREYIHSGNYTITK